MPSIYPNIEDQAIALYRGAYVAGVSRGWLLKVYEEIIRLKKEIVETKEQAWKDVVAATASGLQLPESEFDFADYD